MRRLGNGGVHGDIPRCRRQARVALVTTSNGIDRVEDRDVDDGKGPARSVGAQLLPEDPVLAGSHGRVVEGIGREQNLIPAADRVFFACAVPPPGVPPTPGTRAAKITPVMRTRG